MKGVAGERLHVDWMYSANLHQPGSIEALAKAYSNALDAIVQHCKRPEAGGFTPSDFPKARMNQKNLDKLISKLSRRQP